MVRSESYRKHWGLRPTNIKHKLAPNLAARENRQVRSNDAELPRGQQRLHLVHRASKTSRNRLVVGATVWARNHQRGGVQAGPAVVDPTRRRAAHAAFENGRCAVVVYPGLLEAQDN